MIYDIGIEFLNFQCFGIMEDRIFSKSLIFCRFGSVFGLFWRHLGVLLGSQCTHVRVILGSFRRDLDPDWDRCGGIWECFGVILDFNVICLVNLSAVLEFVK